VAGQPPLAPGEALADYPQAGPQPPRRHPGLVNTLGIVAAAGPGELGGQPLDLLAEIPGGPQSVTLVGGWHN